MSFRFLPFRFSNNLFLIQIRSTEDLTVQIDYISPPCECEYCSSSKRSDFASESRFPRASPCCSLFLLSSKRQRYALPSALPSLMVHPPIYSALLHLPSPSRFIDFIIGRSHFHSPAEIHEFSKSGDSAVVRVAALDRTVCGWESCVEDVVLAPLRYALAFSALLSSLLFF